MSRGTRGLVVFASLHALVAGCLYVLLISEEAPWTDGNWYLAWVALLFCAAFVINMTFGLRYRQARPARGLVVVSAGPALLVVLSLFTEGWTMIVGAGIGGMFFDVLIDLVSANVLLFPSWLGFIVGYSVNSRSATLQE